MTSASRWCARPGSVRSAVRNSVVPIRNDAMLNGPRVTAKRTLWPAATMAGSRCLEALDGKRQETVPAGVGRLEALDVGDRPEYPSGEREVVLLPRHDGAERRRLGAHAVLRPEARQEQRPRKRVNRHQIVVEKGDLPRVVVEDGVAGPVRKPRAVDDEPGGYGADRVASDHRHQGFPLTVVHS